MSGGLSGLAHRECVTIGICRGAEDRFHPRVSAKGLAAPTAAAFALLGAEAAVWSWPFQPNSFWLVLTVGAGCRNSRDRWSLHGPLRLLPLACLESGFGLAVPELLPGGNSKPMLGLAPWRKELKLPQRCGRRVQSGQAGCPGCIANGVLPSGPS